MANKLKDIFLTGKDKVGRPLKYKTNEELESRINDYFNDHIKNVLDEDTGEENQYLQGVTITGLALYLGFCDRHSMYDYKKREQFSHTIKKATTLIEEHYENHLLSRNSGGAIFALKNFGWTDKIEQQIKEIKEEKDYSKLSSEDLKTLSEIEDKLNE